MSIRISEEIMNAIEQLSERLQFVKGPWFVGGSCGLLLHGLTLEQPPRDLDVYADEAYLGMMYEALKQESLDELEYSATAIYESTLSHYDIGGVQIELVGGFKVKALDSIYVVDAEQLEISRTSFTPVGEALIRLMPLGHELLFNLLRNRPDRYHAIAEYMRKDLDLHLPPLRELIHRNQISNQAMESLKGLLGSVL